MGVCLLTVWSCPAWTCSWTAAQNKLFFLRTALEQHWMNSCFNPFTVTRILPCKWPFLCGLFVLQDSDLVTQFQPHENKNCSSGNFFFVGSHGIRVLKHFFFYQESRTSAPIILETFGDKQIYNCTFLCSLSCSSQNLQCFIDPRAHTHNFQLCMAHHQTSKNWIRQPHLKEKIFFLTYIVSN